MNETLVLGVAVLAVWIAVVYLRVPPVVLFLSILVGKLFAEELSGNVYEFLLNYIPNLDVLYVQLALLVIPVLFTILFMRKTTSKSGMLFNALPLLLSLVTLALFINPYINVVSNLDEAHRIILNDNQSYIVVFAALVALVSAWAPRLKGLNKHRKHNKT